MALEKITIQDLDFQENEVLRQTKASFPAYFDIAEKGINLYYDFLHELMEEIPNSDQKHEHYAFLQLYRNAYTIKSIYNLINTGYYFDAMILLRSVVESIVTILFLYKNPQHLNRAIMETEKFQGKFKIRERFEKINYAGGYGDFQNLCRFSHSATLNIVSMFSATPQMDLFPYGISFSEQNASLSIYLFLRHLGMLLDCLQYVFRKRIELINLALLNRCEMLFEELKSTTSSFGQNLEKFRDQYLKLYNVEIKK